MDLERIHYRINKLLPIIIPIALLIIAIICIVVGQTIGSRDRPDTTLTPTPTVGLENIDSEQTLSLQEHLKANCILVEVTYLDNWSTTRWFETYYDHMTADYEQYQVTIEDNAKQYAKITDPCRFIGIPNKLEAVHDTLPADCKDTKFDMLDENMFAVSELTDGYIWIAKQKEEGNTITIAKITATYMDVYLKKGDQQRRAVITDRYILVDDYIGDVPTY